MKTRNEAVRAALLAACLALAAGCGDKMPIVAGKKSPSYRTAPIARTDIVRTVSATGSVTPRNSSKGIPVGAQVNGKLIKLYVDYNDVVTNGQVVAEIDPLVYKANYKSAVARLHMSKAGVMTGECALRQREAELVLAQKTYDRKKALAEKKMAPVADLDSAEESLAKSKAAVESAKAALASAKAEVESAQASVDQAEANLSYCTIVSPVDGIVIDRKVEEGETVVSSMNAVPVLTIAEDLDTIWVAADIPEADIGGIQVGQDVTFTVDAYRTRFKGKVKQIRKASTTTNNVVTFPVPRDRRGRKPRPEALPRNDGDALDRDGAGRGRARGRGGGVQVPPEGRGPRAHRRRDSARAQDMACSAEGGRSAGVHPC